MARQYLRQDAANILYAAAVQTASGNSAEIDWGVIGGALPCEIVLQVGDLEGTATLAFIIQDYVNGAYQDTIYQMNIPALGNGVYTFYISPQVITGNKMRLRHVFTAGTDTDGVVIAGHVAPMSTWAA